MLTLELSVVQRTFVKTPRVTKFNSHKAWGKSCWGFV